MSNSAIRLAYDSDKAAQETNPYIQGMASETEWKVGVKQPPEEIKKSIRERVARAHAISADAEKVHAAKPTPAPAKESRMSDPISREELSARLETVEAKADARFKEIMGEIKASNATLAGKIDVVGAKSAGKWTVWGAAGAIIAAMVATIIVLLQVMQTGYDSGRNAEASMREAVSEEVAAKTSPATATVRPVSK